MRYFILVLLLQSVIPFTCTQEDIEHIVNACLDTDLDGDGDCCTVNRVPVRCDDSTCYEGICVLGNCIYTPKNCDDNDACTHDFCDQSTGDCAYRGTPCCDDSNHCTYDYYDTTLNICQNILNECDDNNACTNGWCEEATGICNQVPYDCDDGDLCTLDDCDRANHSNPCQYIDTCWTNPCAFDTIPDPLYGGQDWCKVVVCDPNTGQTYNTQRSCNDNVACTNDFCAGNQCFNIPMDCADGTGSPYCCEDLGGGQKRCTYDITVCCHSDDPCIYTYWQNDPNDFVHGECVYLNTCRTSSKITSETRFRTTIYGVSGKQIGNLTQIEGWLPKGLYLIRTVTEDGTISTRKVIKLW